MNELPTAEEFFKEKYGINDRISTSNATLLAIEFAKLHVEAALKSASEKAYVEYVDLTDNEIFDYTDVITDDNVGANVNSNSILNAYPLANIK
jgi:hypothetical protein